MILDYKSMNNSSETECRIKFLKETTFTRKRHCNLKPFSIRLKPLKNATFFNPCI